MILSAVGCAEVSPQPMSGPDGRQAYSMRCSGFGRTLEACYAKAGEICPNGYEVVDRATGTVAVPTATGSLMAAPQQSLVIQCK
jgi:hypothetical protein